MATVTRKQYDPRPTNTARTSKLRNKPLLADTIGQSICLQQSQYLTKDIALQVPQPSSLYSPRFHDRFQSVPALAPNRTARSLSISSKTLTRESDVASTGGRSTRSHDIGPSHSKRNSPYSRIVSSSGRACAADVERLAAKYGQASHMGLLDPSYQIFVNSNLAGGVCFKVLNKVAIVMGDPLCERHRIPSVLQEFQQYRRRRRWDISFLGAGDGLVDYAKRGNKKWTILQFGKERVLNPCTNKVICEAAGKRILTQVRQLLNPNKGGITLGIYTPSLQGTDYELEHDLRDIYDDWRTARNTSGKAQAFVTEYDPFLMPSLVAYIYARGPDGVVNGFAALRWIGAKDGYHIDPCIASPHTTQKGITDLLLFASMAWLRQLGIMYLSLGYEPSEHLAEISGKTPTSIARAAQRIYRYTFDHLPIGGKQAYFDKFKPDDEQETPVFLMFPTRIPEPRHVVAMAHAASVSIRGLLLGSNRA